ncbi:MAG: wax ester/triacylglycerol synthase family O-acyltransferase [Desulfobacterales bacterium]|nr:wax ester/triacylglycerol synthase family O-acyltransferase [Desulfobacterales bacterium]
MGGRRRSTGRPAGARHGAGRNTDGDAWRAVTSACPRVDTAWLRMDGPGSTMMIVGVMATATPVRRDDLRRVLETAAALLRALPPARRDRRARRFVGRGLSVRPRRAPGRAVTCRARAGTAELAGAGGRARQHSRSTRRRPLWQLALRRATTGRAAPGCCALHHCYADGIAMIRVLLSLTEQDPGAGPRRRARELAPEGRATRRRRDVLPLLDWIEQLAQPAGDIVENALAEGARLLEARRAPAVPPGVA